MVLQGQVRTGSYWWFSKILLIRTGSDLIFGDQDCTRTEKFHSPLISAGNDHGVVLKVLLHGKLRQKLCGTMCARRVITIQNVCHAWVILMTTHILYPKTGLSAWIFWKCSAQVKTRYLRQPLVQFLPQLNDYSENDLASLIFLLVVAYIVYIVMHNIHILCCFYFALWGRIIAEAMLHLAEHNSLK